MVSWLQLFLLYDDNNNTTLLTLIIYIFICTRHLVKIIVSKETSITSIRSFLLTRLLWTRPVFSGSGGVFAPSAAERRQSSSGCQAKSSEVPSGLWWRKCGWGFGDKCFFPEQRAWQFIQTYREMMTLHKLICRLLLCLLWAASCQTKHRRVHHETRRWSSCIQQEHLYLSRCSKSSDGTERNTQSILPLVHRIYNLNNY